MPELPEVQTIVDDLNKKVHDYKVAGFWTDWKKAIKLDLGRFKKGIIGKRIVGVDRRGKNILAHLDNGSIMHIHLKMTGHLLVKSKKSKIKSYFKEKVNQYIHHIWYLEKDKKKITMEFSDLRKFGKIRLLDEKGLKEDKELGSLGIEPLSNEFTLKGFKKILELKRKKTIRDILMDQGLIAGIGNIYASEILFEAGILPSRKAEDLTNDEKKKIHEKIRAVLGKAIRLRGTSDSDYRDTDGAPGGFQKVLKVYNREKEPCQRRACKGVVKREKIKQRSAFFCEGCQI